MEASSLAVITVVKGTQVNKCVRHFRANAEASTILASGGVNCRANLLVATFSKLCVKVEDIMGSEESLELSSFVPANEGEGEGGGVAEPVDTFCSLPLLLEKKDKKRLKLF